MMLVCGGNHRERAHHNNREIEAALQKLKKSGAYLLAQDVLEGRAADGYSDSTADDKNDAEEGHTWHEKYAILTRR
jgi:hypothetical protein